MSRTHEPTKVEREALLKLLLNLNGPLCWTGPIPYDALGAQAAAAARARGSRPDDLAVIPAQAAPADTTVAA